MHRSDKHYDVVIVGAGMAGLTSAAYLSKSGSRILLIEKENKIGGLLGAITIDGHQVDHGARGIIDSGVFIPMMKQLGLNIELLPNPIKIMVGSKSVVFDDRTAIDDYGAMLKELYPGHHHEIDRIMQDIKKVMGYMDVLYGIENPLFMSKPYDPDYLLKTLLPWMIKFVFNIRQAMKLLDPINDHLGKITSNESLIRIITQHFFENTPTFFALSYFSLYLDYSYPRGSTQTIIAALEELIRQNQGNIINGQEVVRIDASNNQVQLKEGLDFTYKQLIWAADQKTLYKCLDADSWPHSPLRDKVQEKQNFLAGKKGADSVLSLYIIVDQPPESFQSASRPHAFYTPSPEGLTGISLSDLKNDQLTFTDNQKEIFNWLQTFYKQNTYEISIPALRDPQLSPPGQTALIISLLFDYQLTKHIADLGLHDQFKSFTTETIVKVLDSCFHNLSGHIIKTVITTPLTIAAKTNNTEGSLTGWSFANQPFPAEYRFLKISRSVKTPIDTIKQAGQWTFNPAGVPVSILTGKLAADVVIKDLNISKLKGEAYDSPK